jgi:hypothetical protein
MSGQRAALALAGVMLAGALAAALSNRAMEPAVERPSGGAWSCELAPEVERALTLSLRVRTRGDLLGQRDDVLRARLRVQARAGGLGFVVESFEGEGGLAVAGPSPVDAAWAFEMREDCAIERIGLGSDAPDEIVGLARALAMVLTTTVRSGNEWTASEPDAVGVVRSEYRRDARLLTRVRTTHDLIHGAPEIGIDGFRGNATIELAPTGWLASLDIEESGTAVVLGQAVELSTRGSVRSEDHARGTPIELSEPLSWWRLDTPPSSSPRPPPERSASWTTSDASALLSAGSGSDVSAVLAMDLAGELAEHLRREPERAREVLDRIRAPGSTMTAEVRAALFFALELAGTEPAQAALRRVIAEPEEREADHLHAIVALHGVRTPAAESLELLRGLVRDEGLEGPRGRAAVLALATWGSRASTEVEQAARRFVQDTVEPLIVSDPSLALAAVQNLGLGGGFERDVLRLLDSEEPRVRRAAVDATRVLPPAAGWDALLARLSEERVDEVAGAIVQRLISLTSLSEIAPDEGDLQRLAPFLTASDRTAREGAVDVVGALIPRLPSARAVLVRSFSEQHDPATRRRLGRYVTARELVSSERPPATAAP